MPSFYKKFTSSSPVKKGELKLHSGIQISVLESVILLEIPFPATDSIFYKQNKFELEISNDIRLLYSKGEELDSAGIGSLLFLSAAVPPLTPFKNIHTFLPGFKYEISLKTLKITSKVPYQWSLPSEKDFHLSMDDQINILTDLIDKNIRDSCPGQDPIVLFSGGVDSTVLASRVIAMNWKKATFVHYSFGDDDPETRISLTIAKGLNIHIDIVKWNPTAGLQCLQNAAKFYRQPFADHGTVQMYDLFQEVCKRYDHNRTVLDGTGADGAFGLFETAIQSQKLYNIPWFIRRSISSFYPMFSLWKRSIPIEYYIRLFRRSSFLSKLSGFIAHNPLINIGYYLDSKDISLISSSCEEWIMSVAGSSDDRETIPLIDIGLVCARIFAQKDKSLYANSPYRIAYPFMDHEIVDLAIRRARIWPGSSIPKNTLKHMLMNVISPELVYRKKSGFLGPIRETFSHPIFINQLKKVSGMNAPLYKFMNQKLLKEMIIYISDRKDLAFQTYNFLWSATFTNTWLSQLEEISIDEKNDISDNQVRP